MRFVLFLYRLLCARGSCLSYKLVFGNVYNVLVIRYVMKDCVFCKIVAGEINADKILENKDFIVFADANPKVEGHMLVIPKVHCGNFMDLDSGLYGGFLSTVKGAVLKLGCKDFNLVVNNGKVAGQIVGHLHLHILPRVDGDGLKV